MRWATYVCLGDLQTRSPSTCIFTLGYTWSYENSTRVFPGPGWVSGWSINPYNSTSPVHVYLGWAIECSSHELSQRRSGCTVCTRRLGSILRVGLCNLVRVWWYNQRKKPETESIFFRELLAPFPWKRGNTIAIDSWRNVGGKNPSRSMFCLLCPLRPPYQISGSNSQNWA